MKYTKEQRLQIGRRIYEGEITRARAAVEYDISTDTARDYMRLYKASLLLDQQESGQAQMPADTARGKTYEEMTREELIAELHRLQGKQGL